MVAIIKELEAKESDNLATICEYLERRKYFFYRVNTIGVFDVEKKVHRKPSKYTRRGVADIFLLYQGEAFFIEVKTDTGVQSSFQKEFKRDVEANGGTYILATCVADLNEAGL